jgi:hypothetical protein
MIGEDLFPHYFVIDREWGTDAIGVEARSFCPRPVIKKAGGVPSGFRKNKIETVVFQAPSQLL